MSEAARSFRVATWLGWQIESNWTDPFLFAIYSIVKPVAERDDPGGHVLGHHPDRHREPLLRLHVPGQRGLHLCRQRPHRA